MFKNKLKEKLQAGEKLIGTWNTISSPAITEIIASTGIDFLVIDFEHGPFDLSNLTNYTNSCLGHNVSPIVRLPSNQDWLFLQALDQGAHGLICPHISSLKDSEKFTSSTKYHPEGSRGYCPYTKAGKYTHKESESNIESSNEDIFNMAIIESEEGLKNIESICSDKKLDAVYFGSYDISHALGVPADIKNPIVIEAINTAKVIAKKHGKFTGGFVAFDNADMKWQYEQDFDIIMYGVDSYLLKREYVNMLSTFKNKVKE